jgi:hypothetical protein
MTTARATKIVLARLIVYGLFGGGMLVGIYFFLTAVPSCNTHSFYQPASICGESK